MADHDRSSDPPVTIHIIEYIRLPPETQKCQQLRDTRQLAWIANLNTLVPHGLNFQDLSLRLSHYHAAI